MPNSSGTILDWVPQKAAQQMQSDATTRFMPQPRHAPPRRPSPPPPSSAPRLAWATPPPPRARGLAARPWQQNAGTPWQENGALLGQSVAANGSLGRDQMHRRGGALAA